MGEDELAAIAKQEAEDVEVAEAEAAARADMDAQAQYEAEQEELERIYNLAKFMHDEYEKAAKVVGWNTQDKCKVEFDDLPEANRKVMLTVARRVLEEYPK